MGRPQHPSLVAPSTAHECWLSLPFSQCKRATCILPSRVLVPPCPFLLDATQHRVPACSHSSTWEHTHKVPMPGGAGAVALLLSALSHHAPLAASAGQEA